MSKNNPSTNQSSTTRRNFLKWSAAAGSVALVTPESLLAAPGEPAKDGSAQGAPPKGERPNFLWIVAEDLSPWLGAYGNIYARTPHLDRLATQSVVYEQAFAPCPVCAPARSTLATGIYACSLGSHQMRSQIKLPPSVRLWTALLRDAGYFCTNNSKTNYNFAVPKDAWDENNNQAHWRNRPQGRPFFSMFSPNVTHESQIRGPSEKFARLRENLPPAQRHDPQQAPLPPYYPDTPAVREDIARYYDNVSRLDTQVGDLLQQLNDDGLSDNTIVFFFTDHGTGLPRGKRSPLDSGLRVPLFIRFPPRWQHLSPARPGRRLGQLVDFTDFGPSVLSLAGVAIPDFMQGQAFLGAKAVAAQSEAKPDAPSYAFAFRDRMDERYDCARTVRDARFRYVRNFMPHLPAGQHVDYQFQTPTTAVWHALYKEGKLNPAQAQFWQAPRAVEELYDTQSDAFETRNLATDPQYRPHLERLRAALKAWMLDIKDLGLLPEPQLYTRFQGSPYAAVRHKPESYPLTRILAAADILLQSNIAPQTMMQQLMQQLEDTDSAVRYQAMSGLLYLHQRHQGQGAVEAEPIVRRLLDDADPSVQNTAAEWLGLYSDQKAAALNVLLKNLRSNEQYVALHAANVLDRLDTHARPIAAEIEAVFKTGPDYLKRVLEETLRGL